MASPEDTEERFQTLETTLAFQDKTIDDLNEVVTRQQAQIDSLEARVASLVEHVRSLKSERRESLEDARPPHY